MPKAAKLSKAGSNPAVRKNARDGARTRARRPRQHRQAPQMDFAVVGRWPLYHHSMIGVAMKIDEYVPVAIPMIIASAKSLIEPLPKRRLLL